MTSCWPGSACWNRCRESQGLSRGGREGGKREGEGNVGKRTNNGVKKEVSCVSTVYDMI